MSISRQQSFTKDVNELDVKQLTKTNANNFPQQQTKIVATLGPATNTVKTMIEMMRAGRYNVYI